MTGTSDDEKKNLESCEINIYLENNHKVNRMDDIFFRALVIFFHLCFFVPFLLFSVVDTLSRDRYTS